MSAQLVASAAAQNAKAGAAVVNRSLTTCGPKAIPPALEKYIATRDRRMSLLFGYAKTTLRDDFTRLIQGGTVRVGGRASCGGKPDPSWVEFQAWGQIIRKAASLGIAVEATPIKHGNGWATKNGGFWQENDYRLASLAQATKGAA